ncbi:acyl carrier protein [Helcococcus kunzii]|uniref:Acyl carrier protein n=1 Tax=Helcococcus kunzii ATCC 51366 TaxID=883114 RepID=H3NNH0_9FIRM|nr:acyl carrier protein [Helcococcus kunzii]EHR33945.1 acyl carrier protein [Helcococcus kunzii ATCC 51366]MCT1795553.1 acyl carrier protein [Helcococcus kunzii]MCT1989339.1 acyl carrier protein [Helcococcus kunzii]QUY64796.1 acyl carrier protein [Helcococcus kunzii]QZO77237.1 acyl carrier protein [Helcococcus kunzii]
MSSKERIIELVKEELMIDDFDLNADLTKDYELDSIALLDFIMNIEEEFDVQFSDKELNELNTVQDIIDLVEEKTGN